MAVLQGKVAIVTGAGGGIGRGIALAIAKEGCSVAVAGRTLAKLEESCALIEQVGGRAIPVLGDVTNPQDVTRTVQRCVDELGGVDFLVNNAQELIYGLISDSTDEDYLTLFSSGPLATFRFMRACQPHMKRRGGGVIINLTSGTAVQPNPGIFGLYGSVKQCIRSLTRAAACEWAADAIRVIAIAPAAMTPNGERVFAQHPEAARALVAAIPLGRIGDSERDIGRAVVFLLGPDAGYLTGATIPLDGGMANF
jgi:NAD(P)-dependent dehydrogenase (short-subunit alcohol dehydrogenase family)